MEIETDITVTEVIAERVVTEVRFVFLDTSPDNADAICDRIADWLDENVDVDYLITESEDITENVVIYDSLPEE